VRDLRVSVAHTRQTCVLCAAPARSSGAALSPLVCVSALNLGGWLPLAVALGLRVGPLAVPDPRGAGPAWWLLALLVLPACAFGLLDLHAKPAMDPLARGLELYQVGVGVGKRMQKAKGALAVRVVG